MNILIYIYLAFFFDMMFTYLVLDIYRKHNLQKDYTLLEQNPIIRFLIRKSGLNIGMLISAVILFVLLNLVLKFILISENWRYFILGVYSMMLIFHYLNLSSLKKAYNMKWFSFEFIRKKEDKNV
jgi:uncharacterized protein YacL